MAGLLDALHWETYMSVKIVEYISCQNYAYTLIGKSEKSQYIYKSDELQFLKLL